MKMKWKISSWGLGPRSAGCRFRLKACMKQPMDQSIPPGFVAYICHLYFKYYLALNCCEKFFTFGCYSIWTFRLELALTSYGVESTCTRYCVTAADINLYEKFQDYYGLERNATWNLILAPGSLCFCVPHVQQCEGFVMLGLPMK